MAVERITVPGITGGRLPVMAGTMPDVVTAAAGRPFTATGRATAFRPTADMTSAADRAVPVAAMVADRPDRAAGPAARPTPRVS